MSKSKLMTNSKLVFNDDPVYIDLWFDDGLAAYQARHDLINRGIFDFADYSTHCFIKSAKDNQRGWRIYDQDIALLAKLSVGGRQEPVDNKAK